MDWSEVLAFTIAFFGASILISVFDKETDLWESLFVPWWFTPGAYAVYLLGEQVLELPFLLTLLAIVVVAKASGVRARHIKRRRGEPS